MEMSAEYMRETAEHLATRGFALAIDDTELGEGAAGPVRSIRYELTRSAQEHLTLETVLYPDGAESYYLEIHAWHGMRAYSFPLDSWKHRPDRVELKFYALVDSGAGLAFTLSLPPIDGTA